MEQERGARAVERPRLDDEARAKRPHAQVEQLLAFLGGLGVARGTAGRELVARLARVLGELLVDAWREPVELVH